MRERLKVSAAGLVAPVALTVGLSANPSESGTILLGEISTPSNPAADRAVLYIKDNGSGKTQFCVRFSTGTEIVLATQA